MGLLAHEEMLLLSLQCVMEEVTRHYMDKKSYNVTQCLNATNTPCSSPHMKDLIDINVLKGLKTCPTPLDFNCQQVVLFHALRKGNYKCRNPCQKWIYQVTMIEERIPDSYYPGIDTIVSLSFSTNIFTQLQEAQVITIKQ